LGDLTLIANIEVFMLNMCGYFNNSLKRPLEFQGLAQTLETKGNKIFKDCENEMNVHARTFERIMVEYCSLLKMIQVGYITT